MCNCRNIQSGDIVKTNNQGNCVDCGRNVMEMQKGLSENPNKMYPMFEGLLKYFPDALRYVSHVSKVANDQHHPDTPVHWDKTKSTDEKDAGLRHLTEVAKGNELDDDGLLHRGKIAWRFLADLQKYLESQK